jgi:hypothetical protein
MKHCAELLVENSQSMAMHNAVLAAGARYFQTAISTEIRQFRNIPTEGL